MTLLLAILLACGSSGADRPQPARIDVPERPAAPTTYADVDHVLATGNPGAYRLAVTVYSPDQDCDTYADWWEVVTPEGELLYRRILGHSHAQEQPFQRSGGPIEVRPDQQVIVRAHMNDSGYGGRAMTGSVTGGFKPAPDITADFAQALAEADPRPTDCLF